MTDRSKRRLKRYCTSASVHANQLVDWKNQLLERASSVFGAEAAAPTVDLKDLHAKIGQLALENDFLAGALNGPPGPFCRMGKAGMLSAKR